MSFGNLITTTAASISSGGTINGSLTIDGDLTVNGDGSGNYDEIVNGNLTISSTNKLVLGGDGSDTYLQESSADVLDIYVGGANMIKLTESTTDTMTVTGALTIGSDGSGHDVIFYSDTAGDNFTWDSSAEKLTITGTNSATALDIADGNLVVADSVDIEGDIDVNGTSNLDNTDIDGTLAVDGTTISLDATTSLNIDNSNTSNGITIATATSGVPISIGHATSETTVNDNLVVTGDIDANGSLDVDGTTNLDAVDIDGAVQLDSTLTIGADDQGYDVIFYGDTASSNMTWDTSEDDLVLNDSRLLIDQDDNVSCIVFDNPSTTSAHCIDVSTPLNQDGHIFNIGEADTLTTGSAIRVDCGSANLASTASGGLVEILHDGASGGTANNLLFIKNDNASATGVIGIKIQQDANAYALDVRSKATSGASAGAKLRLHTDDTAVMASGDRLGVIEFAGAEDTSNTITVGARIEAITDATWSASENGAYLSFYTTDGNASQSEQMRITSTGLVGIGVTPSNRFHVQETSDEDLNIKFVGYASRAAHINLVADQASQNADWWRMTSDASGNYAIGSYSTGSWVNIFKLDTNSKISLSNNDGGNTGNTIFGKSAFNTSSNNASDYNTAVGELVMGTGSVAGATYNVGVGYKALNALTSGDYNIAIGNQPMLTATANEGNIAIGHDALGDIAVGEEYNVAIGHAAMSKVDEGDANGDADGNIAIGYAALYGGDFSSSDLQLQGNVAIGYEALDATGTAAQTGTIAIGYQAGTAINSNDASGQVLLGYKAGAAMTSARYNTAIGYQAMDANTDGDDNIAIGWEAMGNANNTDCIGNTVVGNGAGDAFGTAAVQYTTLIGNAAGGAINHADASNTTAVGWKAGNALTQGRYSTMVGFESGLTMTTSDGNTAVGYRAMRETRANGDYNTAIGYQAMIANVIDEDVNYCVAVGAGTFAAAMESETSGSVAVGYQALAALTTGARNLAVGYQSMDALEAGDDNIAIGTDSMGACDQGSHTDADINSNVCIGWQAGLGGDFGGSDLNMIENIAIGYGAMDGTAALGATYNTFIGSHCGGGSWATALSTKNVGIGSYTMDAAMNDAQENTAVGYSSLSALTTGDYNVAIGSQTIKNNLIGSKNTAVGYQAMEGSLADNPGHGENVAVGYNAAQGLTSATNVVAIGALALGGDTCTGDSSVAIGYNAGNAMTSGNNNVIMGTNAGKLMTANVNNIAIGTNALDAALDDESYNIAIGGDAMGACNQGSDANSDIDGNVAIGYQALLGGNFGGSNKNANENVAIGYQAMDGSGAIDASNNVFVGSGAGGGTFASELNSCVGIGSAAMSGALASAAGSTVAVGISALAALTEGTGNVAVGGYALDAEDDGDYNTAVGYNALTAQTGTSGTVANTAIGWNAGAKITTGTKNTAIGAESMHDGAASITGDKNTCVGYQAGEVIQGAGAQNTLIGAYAGEDLTTGTRNVCVGHEAEPASATAVNRIVIGDSAQGVADNSVTLGHTDVTAVYMAQDKGATVYANTENLSDATAGEVEFIVMDMTNTTSNNGDCTATISAYGDRLNGGGRRQMGSIKFDKEQQWIASPPSSNDASIGFWGQEDETLTEQFHIASNGDLTARDTSIGSISDSRLKENVEDYSGCLNIVKELRPVTFNYINPSQHQDGKRRGFLAQEIKEVDDYWVGEKEIEEFLEDGLEEQKDKDGKITQEAKARSKNPDFDLCKDTDHISLTSKLNAKDAMYVGAIKELLAKVETLESKVAALEG